MSYGRNTAEIWFPRSKRTGGTRSSDRDGLLDRVQQHLTHRDEVYFGEPDHYYVNSLAYLPFLARAGRYRAPDQPGGLVLD